MNTYTLAEAARKLQLNYGRNTLYAILKNKGIVDKYNKPSREYIDKGYFVYQIKYIKGIKKYQPVTLFTEDGLIWCTNFLKQTESENILGAVEQRVKDTLTMSVFEAEEINGMIKCSIKQINYDPDKEANYPRWIFELPTSRDFLI